MHRWRFCIFHCPRPPTEGGGGESSTLLCPTATLLFDLFLLVTYHERNLQPLAEGEFCNGTSFCLRQEPVSSVASTMRWQVAPMESYLPILCMCTNVRLYFRQVSSTSPPPLCATSPSVLRMCFWRLRGMSDTRGDTCIGINLHCTTSSTRPEYRFWTRVEKHGVVRRADKCGPS